MLSPAAGYTAHPQRHSAVNQPPLTTWLMLAAVVLLVHLSLLARVPLRLNLAETDVPYWRFVTRTLKPVAPTDPSSPSAAATKPAAPFKPKPESAAPPRPTPPSPEPAPTRPATLASAAPSTPTAAEVTPAALPVLPAQPASTAQTLPPATEPMPETMPETMPEPMSEPTAQSANQPTTAASAAAPAALPLADTALAAADRAAPNAEPPARPPREMPAVFGFEGMPNSVKLLYQIKANKFPFNLNGELVWQLTDNHYQASLSFGAFGQTRTQTSRGTVGEQGLAPERFSDKYRSEVAAHFNRAQGKVTFSANTPDVPLLSGAQDRLSVLIQLAAMAASAPERFSPATTLTLQTVGPRDADLWLFTVGDLESIELPNGPLDGLKLTRMPRQAYDQQVDIWLAPRLGYMPARIRITEANGDYIDMQWAASEAVPSP